MTVPALNASKVMSTLLEARCENISLNNEIRRLKKKQKDLLKAAQLRAEQNNGTDGIECVKNLDAVFIAKQRAQMALIAYVTSIFNVDDAAESAKMLKIPVLLFNRMFFISEPGQSATYNKIEARRYEDFTAKIDTLKIENIIENHALDTLTYNKGLKKGTHSRLHGVVESLDTTLQNKIKMTFGIKEEDTSRINELFHAVRSPKKKLDQYFDRFLDGKQLASAVDEFDVLRQQIDALCTAAKVIGTYVVVPDNGVLVFEALPDDNQIGYKLPNTPATKNGSQMTKVSSTGWVGGFNDHSNNGWLKQHAKIRGYKYKHNDKDYMYILKYSDSGPDEDFKAAYRWASVDNFITQTKPGYTQVDDMKTNLERFIKKKIVTSIDLLLSYVTFYAAESKVKHHNTALLSSIPAQLTSFVEIKSLIARNASPASESPSPQSAVPKEDPNVFKTMIDEIFTVGSLPKVYASLGDFEAKMQTLRTEVCNGENDAIIAAVDVAATKIMELGMDTVKGALEAEESESFEDTEDLPKDAPPQDTEDEDDTGAQNGPAN